MEVEASVAHCEVPSTDYRNLRNLWMGQRSLNNLFEQCGESPAGFMNFSLHHVGGPECIEGPASRVSFLFRTSAADFRFATLEVNGLELRAVMPFSCGRKNVVGQLSRPSLDIAAYPPTPRFVLPQPFR